MLYRIFRSLVRLALHLFFRRIEVEGQASVPQHGPVLFVPNHTNALVDPLIVAIALRRRVTLTAKNVLAKNPLLGWLMRALGVVTFHRREDVGKGAARRENVRSLQQCREILANRGAICIFPEGVSHSDARLRPFRLGPARIALDFLRKDGNPGRLRIVPVGLLYTEKDQFRSDVWLRFGQPIDVARWVEEHPDGDAETLTDEIHRRVESLTLNFERRRESYILSWAAEIMATDGTMPTALGGPEQSVADWFRQVGRLQAGYQSLVETRRAEIDELSTRTRRYRSELRRLGVDPAEVYLPLNARRAILFLVRELELLVVGLPLALFGVLNHLLPYLVVRLIARKLSTDKDHWASNVVYPGLVIFPFFYVVQLLVAWLMLSPLWAAIYSVALPFTGYYALLYRDRSHSSWRRARTFVYFLFNRGAQERLAREGREIIGQIRSLGERQPARVTGAEVAAVRATRPAFVPVAVDFETQLADDVAALHELVAGLDRLQAAWTHARQTVQARSRGYFIPQEDDMVRQILLSYRNYRLALYEIIDRHAAFEQLGERRDQLRAFMVGYAAAMTLYAKSLLLVAAYEHEPLVRAKLNESDAKFGIEDGFFDDLLAGCTSLGNYRSLAGAGRYWWRQRRDVRRLGLTEDLQWSWLCDVIRRERLAVRRSFWTVFRHRLRFDWRVLRQSLFQPADRLRYGIQSFIGGTFAGLRTTLNYQPALDGPTLEHLRSRLRSGDVLLVRSERKVTTALLPGFWAHAALFIDSRRDLARLGIGDHPHVRRHWDAIPEDGGRFGYVLEAIAPGVVLSPLEKCLYADHVVALRPNVPDTERPIAIVEAFGHAGKPYDFEFDFNVSTRLVCTELIYRSYNRRGKVAFQLTKRLGRYTLSGDDMMNQFLQTIDEAGEEPAPFDVVSLVIQRVDQRPHLVPPGERLALLRAIRGGFRPSVAGVGIEQPSSKGCDNDARRFLL